MTAALQKAFATAAKLPGPMQNQLASQLVEDIRAELKWDRTLARSQPTLEALAEKARKARRAGRVHRKGFDQL